MSVRISRNVSSNIDRFVDVPTRIIRWAAQQRDRSASGRWSAVSKQLLLEVLEDRRLLASDFYWASGEKIHLIEQTDQFAIKIDDPNPDAVLAKLTERDGLLAD